MGLRVHNNATSLLLINNLSKQTKIASQASERIASGFRINSSADDPAGLVFANNLRSQYLSLEQAVTNAQFASGHLDTATSALDEARTLLDGVRTNLLAVLNDPSQAAVLQDSVDAAIDSIGNIASTTRFNNKYLLNGSTGYSVTGRNAGADIQIRRAVFQLSSNQVQFAPRVTSAVVISRASQANRFITAGATVNAASTITVRITGSLGSKDITVVSNTTTAAYRAAVNSFRDFTGVYASGNRLFSDDFGSTAAVSVAVVTGQSYGVASSVGTDFGRDITGTINGLLAQGRGTSLTLNTAGLALTYTFSSRTAPAAFDQFSIFPGGLKFQIGDQPTGNDLVQFGVESIDPGLLGGVAITVTGGQSGTKTVGGFLSSVKGGGTNDLDSNPGNALRIVDAAAKELDTLNGFLGSLSAQTIDPLVNTLNRTIISLKDTEETIRGADVPAETIKLSGAQILAQASVAVLGQTNFLNNSLVATLLGFSSAGI